MKERPVLARPHRFARSAFVLLALAILVVTNLQGGPSKSTSGPPAPGNPLPGLTRDELQRFTDGQTEFMAEEDVGDGLGAVFNDVSCNACHNGPAPGGGSAILSTRIGTRTNGAFDPLVNLGGPVLQTKGILAPDGYQFQGEIVPAEATIVAHRRATGMYGFGLVDSVDDWTFMGIAAMQSILAPEMAGRPNKVVNLMTGQIAVGKFGWKAQRATVLDFAAEAYKEEMGITSAGLLPDADGRSVADENCPQGQCELLAHNPSGTGPDEADLTSVNKFNDFIRFLAPPAPGPNNAQVQQGGQVFASLGCAVCHQPTLWTGRSATKALSFVTFHPYSDFLLHDIGTGDGIEQGVATGGEMRTAPLWGLKLQPAFLHDNRAATVEDAIRQHAGQAQGTVQKFLQLDSKHKTALLEFLNSL